MRGLLTSSSGKREYINEHKMKNSAHKKRLQPGLTYWLPLLMLISLALCCSVEKKDWEKAQAADTIASYNEYLEEHPERTHVESAKFKIKEHQFLEHADTLNLIPVYKTFLKNFPRSPQRDSIEDRLEKLYNKRHPEFIHARTAKILFKHDLGEADTVRFDIENIAKKSMLYAGLELKDDGPEEPDVVLEIDVRGKPLVETYSSFGKQYSGAVLSGTITFRTSKGFVYREVFAGKSKPPSLLWDVGPKGPHPTPSSAPWETVFTRPGSFCEKFVEIIHRFFGTDALVMWLSSYNVGITDAVKHKVREMNDPSITAPFLRILERDQATTWAKDAISILGTMEDPRAVELLISSLRGEYSEEVNKNQKNIESLTKVEDQTADVRRAAAWALGKIKDPRAVEPLISALQDPIVQFWAAQSLKEITGEDFGENKEKWQAWWENTTNKSKQE